jgi:hypothetical protein
MAGKLNEPSVLDRSMDFTDIKAAAREPTAKKLWTWF